MGLEMVQLYPRDLLKDKSKWYRLPEREHTKAEIKKFPIGSWIEADRIIIRAGYYYQPEDMPDEELDRQRIELVTMNINWLESKGPLDRKAIEMHMTDPHIYPSQAKGHTKFLEGPITQDTVAKVLGVILNWGNIRLGQMDYELKGEWVKQQRQKLESDAQQLRTFWYVDYDFAGQVREYKNKQIGVRVPGSMIPSYWDNEYDPPYLDAWLHQNLYMIGWSDPGVSFVNRRKEAEIYVHPADMKE